MSSLVYTESESTVFTLGLTGLYWTDIFIRIIIIILYYIHTTKGANLQR